MKGGSTKVKRIRETNIVREIVHVQLLAEGTFPRE